MNEAAHAQLLNILENRQAAIADRLGEIEDHQTRLKMEWDRLSAEQAKNEGQLRDLEEAAAMREP